MAIRIGYNGSSKVIRRLCEAVNQKQDAVITGRILLAADAWTGSGSYTQSISILGATPNSKIDLQPDGTVLSQLSTDGVTALWVENDDGVLTAHALDAAPTAALSVQYTKTEIINDV